MSKLHEDGWYKYIMLTQCYPLGTKLCIMSIFTMTLVGFKISPASFREVLVPRATYSKDIISL
jgi:hypothetical protein